MNPSVQVGDVFEGYPPKAQKVVHVVVVACVVGVADNREHQP
jgi:hypothetical protein